MANKMVRYNNQNDDEEQSEEQLYFKRASSMKNLVSPISAGLNVDLTIAQRYSGLNAPVSSFYNPVIDDLQRDLFWSMYLWKFGLLETPPEGREITRQLLEWVLNDPAFDKRRFMTINAQISAAAGANKLVDELLKDQNMKQGMNQMGNAEQKEQQADDLEQQADEQENGGDQDNDNPNDQDDQDGDGQGGGQGEDEQEDEQEPETTPEEKRQQANKLRQQAQKDRERGQQKVEQALNGKLQSVMRSGAISKAQEFAGEVGAFLSSWGIEQGEGLDLSMEELQTIMRMMTQKGLSNLTSLMGRAYGIALSVLKGRSPVEIMVDTGGLTKNILDISIDQLAMLGKGVPEAVRQDTMLKFFRSGLPGVTRTSQAKQEGAFIWRNDGSDSMSSRMKVDANDPNSEWVSRSTVSNALLLGIAKAAKENNQSFNLATFGSSGQITDPITEASPLKDLLRFAEFAFGGGTSIDYALNDAMNAFDALDEDDKLSADIGISTDGEAGVSDSTKDRLWMLKEQYGVRLHVLLIADASYGDIDEVADNLLQFKSLDGIADVLAHAMWNEDKRRE